MSFSASLFPKTANIKDPTFNGALGTRDKTKHLEVTAHFLHKDASDPRGVDSVLTVRRLRRTLPASTCASERADIAVARPERVLGSRRGAPKFNLEKLL